MTTTQRGRFRGSLGFGVMVILLTGAAPSQRQDAWDAVFRGNLKVGQVHTYVEPVEDRGRKLLRVRVDMELNLRRQNDQVSIKLRYGTIETLDGEVLKIDHRSTLSDREMRTFGSVIDGQMVLKLEGGGQRVEQRIPWGPEVRGPYAPEQSLARKPISAGEVRELKQYIPDLNAICDITLTAAGREEVVLGDGKKRSLMKVEQTTMLKGKSQPEFNTTLWIDDTGQVLKSAQDVLGGFVFYRTTEQGANTPNNAANVDSIMQSVIKVTNKISRAGDRHDVRYRITHKTDNPAELLPADRRQTVTPGKSKTSAILEVRTAGLQDGTPGAESVDEQYMRPNALITSADRTVQQVSREAVGRSTDPWEKAVKIEKWVHENLKDKNFSTTFAPASEVARNLTGDCTEHSVLAAAMSRAQGIPARVVVGLIYVDGLGGFGFHMWHEVYVNQRWVALDASFDQSSVDATHIKLADSSMDGVSPYEAFLPVVRVFGKMTIEPLELR